MMFSISSAICFVVGGLPVWFNSIFTGKMCRQVYVVTIKLATVLFFLITRNSYTQRYWY